jgi:hypothetical protein
MDDSSVYLFYLADAGLSNTKFTSVLRAKVNS